MRMLRYLKFAVAVLTLAVACPAQFSINGIQLLSGANPPAVTGPATAVDTNVGATVHVTNNGPVTYDIRVRNQATGVVVTTVEISNPFAENVPHGLPAGNYDIEARAGGGVGAWTDIADLKVH